MNENTENEENNDSTENIPTVTKPVQVADLKKVGVELISEMPKVSENAVEQYEQEKAQEKEIENRARIDAAGKVDRHGNSFDPALHKVDVTGAPLLTVKGKLRMKVGAGRPKASATQGRSTLGKSKAASEPVSSPTGIDSVVQARATGRAAANTLIMLGVVVGGDEWQPVKSIEHGIDEKHNLETAFADYFEATGKTDFPAGMALTIAVVGYAAPRFTMPKTKKKSANFFLWVRDKWQARKLKRQHAKGVKAKQRQKEVEKKEDE